jgi:hypothetical protein
MRVLLIVLRVFVFLLGVGGALAAGFVGVVLTVEQDRMKEDLEKKRKEYAIVKALVQAGGSEAERAKLADVDREFFRLERGLRAYPFFLACFPLGVLGGILGLVGRTNSAAALLLVSALGPLVLFFHTFTLAFTSGLLAAGVLSVVISLLAFLTRPRPEPALAVAGRD